MRTKPFPIGLRCLVVAGALAPGSASAGNWWLEAGPVYRTGMSIKLSGSSQSQQEGVHAAPPAPAGAGEGYADRVYDDGYVKLDSGTTDPNAVGGPGLTWNWAYDQAGQFDADHGLLSFHRNVDHASLSTLDGPLSARGDLDGFGLELRAGRAVSVGERWRFDLGLGVQCLWGMDATVGATSYRENIGNLNLTDRFDVAGAVHPDLGFAPPRTAPGGYAGTFEGPAGESPGWVGGYPVIPNVPTSRDSQMDVTSTAANQVTFRLSEDFYEITVQPQVSFRMTQGLTGHLTPKIGVAIAVVDAERTEVFAETPSGGTASTLRTWSNRQSSSEAFFTCGLSAGIDAALGDGFFLGAFGGYDWVVDPPVYDLGPSRVEVDNSGWSVGLVLRKEL